MDYYEKKRRAWQQIDDFYKNGLPTKHIYYKISLLYGFDAKFCDKRIKLLEELGE